jgi:hypothetical protein
MPFRMFMGRINICVQFPIKARAQVNEPLLILVSMHDLDLATETFTKLLASVARERNKGG